MKNKKWLLISTIILLGIVGLIMIRDKVYTPKEISDSTLPGETITNVSSSQPSSGETYSAGKTTDNKFPQKAISYETISSSLNTKTKKILQEYEFTEQGAIQVGKYDNGVSGDLRITPVGITARDKAGITTFAIDGESGDAVFKGEVKADDFVISDGQGLVSLSNFTSVGSANNALNQTLTTDGANVVITGSTLTFDLERPSVVLISAAVSGWIDYDAGDVGSAWVFLTVSEGEDDYVSGNYAIFSGAGSEGGNIEQTGSINHFAVLPAGTHTLKLYGTLNIVANTPQFVINNFGINYAVLGK